MPWLLRDRAVLASLEVLETRRDRRRGALKRERLEGALLLRPAYAVHTFGMRFSIDVAFLDEDLVVLAQRRSVPPWRLTGPHRRCRCIIEAEAGSFERWGLSDGDKLEVEGDTGPGRAAAPGS